MNLVRPDLAELPTYSAGGLRGGRIRLASNESPHGLLPAVRDVLAGGGAERYPDFRSSALREELARRHGVTAEEIAIGCGSSALCYDLARLRCVPADRVAGPWRSFEAYPILAGVVGARWHPVPLTDGGRLDLAALAAAAGQAALLFVCNPNNPTATAFGQGALDSLLDSVPPDTLLVLDEAYFEYAGSEIADGVAAYRARRPRNLVVLRTFSKAYGLAGLRVGYCVGPPGIVAAVHAVQVPFAVNLLAQRAALAALSDEDEVARRCKEVVRRRTELISGLNRHGYAVAESHANFVWLPLGDRSTEFADHCGDHDIAVRPFPGEGVRTTIGSEEECAAFLAAAAGYAG